MRIDKSIVQKIESALRFSTAEGMAYGAVMGFGDNYIVAFAVALQVNSFLIGILCSVPGFLASLAQLGDVALIRRFKSRKLLVLTFALLQGLMFLPMLGLAFFPGNSDAHRRCRRGRGREDVERVPAEPGAGDFPVAA